MAQYNVVTKSKIHKKINARLQQKKMFFFFSQITVTQDSCRTFVSTTATAATPSSITPATDKNVHAFTYAVANAAHVDGLDVVSIVCILVHAVVYAAADIVVGAVVNTVVDAAVGNIRWRRRWHHSLAPSLEIVVIDSALTYALVKSLIDTIARKTRGKNSQEPKQKKQRHDHHDHQRTGQSQSTILKSPSIIRV